MNLLDILGRIGFDWQVALANLFNFLIIFLLLKYFAFKPIAKIIADRKAKINQGLDDAQQAETNKLLAQEQAQEIVTAARAEAHGIVAHAEARVQEMLLQAQDNARVQATDMINEAHRKIEKDRLKMNQELRAQSARLIVESVQKIMMDTVHEKEHDKIMNKALELMRSE
ncbi:MAG: F0F1 ATP synthase subunit B [Candidatus Pacebacteria bacterium]|nr:F0F1 ATP synthase subunit B [Candidatus Paceibacterota bacterium]MCD8508265.1 F0F1 ATP synthase subunit B [Candidatus Paceibacterota bacterium]MCD8527741.1 F0F1 ATP synthase subunit B [Candidatus Paceibacterota bacterium]MCD8563490.1 F0F1 ATP synthase subunit B [Candidatus Paceibacterota bacterium]